MGTIGNLLRKVQALDTDAIIDKSIDETTHALEDINRQRMQDGIRSDGTEMPNYSKVSQEVYGYPDEPIKLLDTGAFQGAIRADREGDKIVTTSINKKTDMLVGRYGPEIFGTGGSYHNEYVNENFRPQLQKNITAATGLKFSK